MGKARRPSDIELYFEWAKRGSPLREIGGGGSASEPGGFVLGEEEEGERQQRGDHGNLEHQPSVSIRASWLLGNPERGPVEPPHHCLRITRVLALDHLHHLPSLVHRQKLEPNELNHLNDLIQA